MSLNSSNKNPLLKANFFSRFFLCWLSDLITTSHKKSTLHLDDLYELPVHLHSIPLTDKLETNWYNEIKQNPQNPNLIRATLRTVGWKLLLIGLLLVPFELLNILQPLLVIHIMKFFEPCSTMTGRHAWLTALAIILVLLFMNLLFHQYVYRIHICALQMRLAYSGLIFRKVLRLSSHAMNNFTSGQITNLLANDASKAELVHFCLNYLWIAPLQIVAVVILLWYFIQHVTLIAIGYTLLLVLIQPLFSRLFLRLRTDILKITDERVKIMSEIIKSMRIVKMYCWEAAFERKIRHIRTREIIKTTLLMMFTCIETVLSHSYINIVFLFMYGTMWMTNKRFDAGLFTLLYVLLNYTRQSCVMFLNIAIRDILNYIAAQKRIRTFLLLDESERDHRLKSSSFTDANDDSIKQIPRVLCDIKLAEWEQDGKFSLKNVRFDANPGDLICIIGPVGCGKSSLLQTLTGEITHFDGSVRLHGTFCYVPQESWIFSSTIKNNILFGKEYDHELYQRVVHATALDTDFEQLSHGGNTLVGDQGVMLSGGQKARVNLARGLYRDADIYLLDDPLSAVDAKVSKHIFEESIRKFLCNKICILATHQMQFIQDATKILVLDNGELIQIGSYEELLKSSSAVVKLLEKSKQQTTAESMNEEKAIVARKEDKNLVSEKAEIKAEGTVNWKVYFSYLQAGIGVVLGLIFFIIIFGSQQAISVYSNWWLATWSNDESFRYQNLTNCAAVKDNKAVSIFVMNEREWNQYRNQRFYIFCGLVALLTLLIFLRTIFCRLICLNAGRVLHNKMFTRLMRCPISFFDTNPVGRILNRFTSDVAAMDESLPLTVFEFLGSLSQVLGIIILVGFINPWSFIPALIATFGMLFLRYRFAPCSRDLKRLVATTRSPVYSQLTSTIHGLKVIRSYHAENVSSNEFHSHLDDNTRVAYLIATLNRWSAMRFDWVSLIFIAVVILLAMVARVIQHAFSAVEIALTLTYSINLMGIFQYTIRQSVEVETQMTSVERVMQYCQLHQETSIEKRMVKYRPPPNWPSQGCIIFENVSISHCQEPQAPLALRNISLIIKSNEKIGIVGRTGAGKSSFIQSLFRMGTHVNGRILIDDVDIASVELENIRCRISSIPQDPVLFTGTMRYNLDPFGFYSDAEIWNALEQVQLKTFVTEKMSNSLHSLVSEGGSNLSVGQKQLICLARAILRKSKILVIDEATANVDIVTDSLIQKAIRDKFMNCTVLTVAHRLRTVIDSDRIMVLHNGILVEFDSPQVLLSNENSHFSSLVEQTGAAEARHLRALAHAHKLQTKQGYEVADFNEISMSDTNETDPLIS